MIKERPLDEVLRGCSKECEILVEGQTPKIHPQTVTWKEAEKLQEQEGCEEEPEEVLGEKKQTQNHLWNEKNWATNFCFNIWKGEKMSTSSFSGDTKMM